MNKKMNKFSILTTTAFLISIVALVISLYTMFKDHGSKMQAIADTTNTPISNEQKIPVRIYGFVCNKDGVLWESHREKIDITQAVIIYGKLVHCAPNKNDSVIDGSNYLMGSEGYFVIDGVKHSRSEIFSMWDK